jgi:DNA-directed RNA polymerase specialized sigma24 family protein
VDEQDEAGFREYAVARQGCLRRVGYLLCGDWSLAEDLAQTALVKLYAAWPRVRRGREVDAYARRILYRTFLSEIRRRRWYETPTEELPEVADREDPVAQRLVVRQGVVAVSAAHHWTPVLDAHLALAAPLAGALVGLAAGVYPAVRAARREPVDALRSGV